MTLGTPGAIFHIKPSLNDPSNTWSYFSY